MRSVSCGVRVFSLCLGFVLAACGGSSSTKDGGHDAAAGSDGAAGNDGAAGGDVGTGGNDGGIAGAEGCIVFGDCDASAPDVSSDTSSDLSSDLFSDVSPEVSSDASSDVSSDLSSDGSVEAPPAVGLCTPYAIHAPVVVATIVNDGAAPYVAGFVGGALASGTYDLTNVVHFGATYAGPTQEVLVVDATAHTLGDAAVTGTTTTYVGYATTISTANILVGAPSCGGATATSWNYLVTGTGAGSTVSLNAVGSSDVKVFTKQ